jgi:hypothetical protein
VKGKDLYLLSVFRRRLEYSALKRAVRGQQALFAATDVLIEDKASGTQLIPGADPRCPVLLFQLAP